MEGEAIGSGVLVGRECGFPSNWGQALRIVGQAPDVDLPWGQGQEGAWRPQPVRGGGGHGGILCQAVGEGKAFPVWCCRSGFLTPAR